MAAPELVLIAAVARNGVIGRGNDLPWRIPEDMRFFTATTSGHAVIMGRRTWESLPLRFRPLPSRRNLVVTREAAYDAPGAEVCVSLHQALTRLDGCDRAFVIGGAQLYEQALPLADTLLLTEVHRDFEGDVRFPDWPQDQFVETSRTHHDAGGGLAFDHVEYRRKR